MLAPPAVTDHGRVVVRPLTDEDFVVTEPCRATPEVPFADQGGFVAGLSQQFGEGLLRAVEPIAILQEAVDMAVPTGQDDGPARPTDGVCAEAVAEEHPLMSDAVEVRSLINLGTVARQRV